ncbi:lytic polysaccharide monooxygenase [Patellaria atrata CBS 101060]|uniref:Lytic polysaccharide monooxygenase n=1 Tax=Patellaria atrata CBS 101060 TaxID=1346257 RepID=A0A9P4S8F9_9PEZI|nr:lytic polysaccharide monooxygenase [Patellaria atrata CBS 101060]
MRVSSTALASTAVLVSSVAAHGHVAGIISGGKWYSGWDPAYAYANPAPAVAGWKASNLDNGFVSPDAFGSADIACHKSSSPGQAYVPVNAGDTIGLAWNTWPDSHKGPVIDYLAACSGECTSASASSLRFEKIAQGGLISGSNPGTWVTDTLIKNNVTWNVKIPSNLKAGNYVLRHEIIALHAAGQPNGAQAYPQCVNLKVSGGGSAVPGGVPATSFYTASDPGIRFNLYGSFSSYPIPGPALGSLASRVKRHARDFFNLLNRN